MRLAEASWAFPHPLCHAYCCCPCSAQVEAVTLVRLYGCSITHSQRDSVSRQAQDFSDFYSLSALSSAMCHGLSPDSSEASEGGTRKKKTQCPPLHPVSGASDPQSLAEKENSLPQEHMLSAAGRFKLYSLFCKWFYGVSHHCGLWFVGSFNMWATDENSCFFFLAYLFQRNFPVFTVQLVTLQQTRQFLTKVSCCHQIRIGGGCVPLMGRKKEGKEALLVLASGMPTFSRGAAILCKKIFQTQVIGLGSRKCPGLVPV